MIGRIYAIAINTFREAVRDRVLYGVLAFASAVLMFTLALAELSLEQQQRVVMDVGLASISLFSVLVAIFLGSSLLYKEIERKTLYVILPRPLARWEFLVGKYLGIVITAQVFIAIMGAVQLWVASIQGQAPALMIVLAPLVLLGLLVGGVLLSPDRTAVLVPWSLVALATMTLVASQGEVDLGVALMSLILTAAEVWVLAAVALFFSSFSTPFLTGVLTLGVWLIGRSADDMANMQGGTLGEGVKALLRVLAEVFPNFNLFVPGRHTLTTLSTEYGGPWLYVGESVGYAALYAAILLALAAAVFRKRDFL